MAISFKQFAIDEDNIVTVGSTGPTDQTMGVDWQNTLNDQFADAFDAPILSPAIGYGRVHQLMLDYQLTLPVFAHPLASTEDEHIYLIDGPQRRFLYVAYVQTDSGLYDFYAEIMDEPTLNDFLSSSEDEGEPLDT